MEEIHNLRWYIEDSVNMKAVEGLDDISLAICFLKHKTPVLPKWVGNLEGTYFLVKIFLDIFTSSHLPIYHNSVCTQVQRLQSRIEELKEHSMNV